ncbi:MAG TPA: SGNH/GDSL hydrolase family protein [Drouetiella sp.]|jgi:lysophospholipase L1-like esterase
MFVSVIKKLTKGNAVAVRYLLISLVGLLLLCFAVDAYVIPTMEDNGKIASTGWKAENDKLLHSMHVRNKADDNDPVWRSDLFPVSVEKTSRKRILVLGDSYVWGHGYSNLNTIWWRQLQLELERRGYHDVEVVGAGLRGAATWRELGWARKLIPEYKPDLVIWGYVTNDPDEGEQIAPTGGHVCKALIVPKDEDFPERVTKLMEGAYPNLAEQLLAIRKKRRGEILAGDRYGWQFGDWEQKIVEGDNFEHYKKTIKSVADYTKQSGVPAFYITFPNAVVFASNTDKNENFTGRAFYENVRRYYENRYAPVRQAFTLAGMPFYDILNDFVEYVSSHAAPGSEAQKFLYLINPVNSHPGPLACHYYAVKAADYIEANYKDALGPRTLGKTMSNLPVINDCVPSDIQLRQNKDHAFFVYPEGESDLLNMPLRKPFVLLNLAHATRLSEIKLIGEQLKEGDLSLTFEDPAKNYDDGIPVELGIKKGGTNSWRIPDKYATWAVSSVRVNAKFKGENHGVILDMIPAAGVAQ